MKKILCFLIVALMAAVSLMGCSASGTQDGGSEKRDTLTVGISTEPTSLDPVETSLVYNDAVLRLLYDNLIRLDENMNYIPHLAESYEAISDTEWRFVLRENIKFTDGSAMTSEDDKRGME